MKKKSRRHPAMIRLAIVGTGGMANMHAEAFNKITSVKMAAVCDVDEARARSFAQRHAREAVVSTDFARLLRDVPLDAVSIVTPDHLHAPLSLQALAAGKHVLCEKPLALNYPDARRMARAAARAGVVNMVNFSYRNAPAIEAAARLVASGEIGEIVHVEASYRQSWLTSNAWGDWKTNPSWLWRLSSKHGSRGVLGDVGVHILDFATYPVGPVKSVQARLKTFVKLKGRRIGKYVLDANDSALMQVEFANGALGVIHATRWATGHLNSLLLEISGTKGALRVELDRSRDTFEVCAGSDINQAKWRTLRAAPTPHIYERFIAAIRTGVAGCPDFARGAEIQKILDGCFASDRTGRSVIV
jgi:predicted dehydrogenase